MSRGDKVANVRIYQDRNGKATDDAANAVSLLASEGKLITPEQVKEHNIPSKMLGVQKAEQTGDEPTSKPKATKATPPKEDKAAAPKEDKSGESNGKADDSKSDD